MEIVEVGPRDGLQNEGTVVGTVTKVTLIERMLDAGVRRIEATSFVHAAPDIGTLMDAASRLISCCTRRRSVGNRDRRRDLVPFR